VIWHWPAFPVFTVIGGKLLFFLPRSTTGFRNVAYSSRRAQAKTHKNLGRATPDERGLSAEKHFFLSQSEGPIVQSGFQATGIFFRVSV